MERISAGQFLAEYWIKNGLSPKDTEHLKEKEIHLREKYGHMFPPKETVFFIPFIMGIPMPYDFGKREVEPDLHDLEVMFWHKHGYNV